MHRVIRSACPMDCLDSCCLLVSVEGGRVVRIEGDPVHPPTGGFVCGKAKKQIERLYSGERVTYPMLKAGGGWKRISWDEASGLMAEKLTAIKKEYGPAAVLHIDSSGSNGVLKKLCRRFFNAYGGVSVPKGSLCWGSGYAAQEYDFGALCLNDWEGLLNSRTIVLWGRDPATTNIHLVPYLKRAREKGARVVAVNPLKIRSLEFCDLHVSPRPGTDGALALAMANVIIEEGHTDRDFLENHVHGFDQYREMAARYSPERAEGITGVPAWSIRQFARMYAAEKPSSILFGYGLQRYSNGGCTVRAIDALAAITGNIGLPGGGANYAHQYWKKLFSHLSGSEMALKERSIPWPTLARSIMDTGGPPIKCIVVTRSNPAAQLPNTGLAVEVFRKMDFVAVVDHFVNDTADMADLFLPSATFLEEDDLIVSSWSNYLFFAPKVVEPAGECRPDPVIFTDLAGLMGLEGFPPLSPARWLEKALEPLAPLGITLEKLKEGPVRNPLAPAVAWEDKKFPTPTGKYELYSERALAEGADPLPVYRDPAESTSREYPFRLLTCHHRDYLHSQFQNLRQKDGIEPPEVEINPGPAAERGIEDGSPVVVKSPRGQVEAVARVTDRVPAGVVQIYQGGWIKHGRGVNFLTPDHVPDMGLGTPYYDCICRVERRPG